MTILSDTLGAIVPTAAIATLAYIAAKKLGLLGGGAFDGGEAPATTGLKNLIDDTSPPLIDPGSGKLTEWGAESFTAANDLPASIFNPSATVSKGVVQGSTFGYSFFDWFNSDAFLDPLGNALTEGRRQTATTPKAATASGGSTGNSTIDGLIGGLTQPLGAPDFRRSSGQSSYDGITRVISRPPRAPPTLGKVYKAFNPLRISWR